MIMNFLGYYSVWWSVALFENSNKAYLVILVFSINLIFHLLKNRKKIKSELILMTIISVVGILFDLLMQKIGVFELKGHFLIWLPFIWITFSTTICHSMTKIFGLNNYILFLLGLIFGPLSYFSASKFDLLIYTNSFLYLLLHGFFWGGLMISIKLIKGQSREVF
ncbi:MAG: DUF2878 domain-containing protein [Bacteriovorax sp.]|nr:DUF2878 domain-containing protein [Bacteriovorax sp.]